MNDREQFHILSFEGPDPYARAGGIASRVSGLASALAEAGHETHLWFIGDPDLPGLESDGLLTFHRWCQWISAYHPSGAYDGEEGKRRDFAASLPPYLLEHYARPKLDGGGRVVVIAEEWHTVDAAIHLDAILSEQDQRDRATIFWNANNVFGFDHLPWDRLASAATITTVSRYMKQRMWHHGVDPVVIPNGLGSESFAQPASQRVEDLRAHDPDRLLLSKIARWDPDKRWILAIDTVSELKQRGARPLFVARGGMEAHESEVLAHAQRAGLRIAERWLHESGEPGIVSALGSAEDADFVVLRSHLDADARGLLFQASDAVLANSGHEPFGLVGLEAMAVGGIACTGASGEDYAVDGQNALVLQQNDPREFVRLFSRLWRDPERRRHVREAGMRTAREYAWPRVVDRALLPRI